MNILYYLAIFGCICLSIETYSFTKLATRMKVTTVETTTDKSADQKKVHY